MAPRLVYFLLASLLLGSTLRGSALESAFAQAAPESSPTVDCQNASSTVEINYCVDLNYQKADRALNQTYQQLKSTLNSDQETKLVAAQQAWIEYRDKNCDFDARNWVGGTGHTAALIVCQERVTQKRTQELKNLQH